MNKLKKTFHFLGPRIVLSIFCTVSAALLLGFVEFLFATFLDQLMRSIGVLSDSQKSLSLFGLDFGSLETRAIFYVLLGIVVLRGILQLTSQFGSEYSRAHLVLRLRKRLIGDVIWQKVENRIRLDEIGNMLGEIFPKAGEAVITLSKSTVAASQGFVLIMGMYAAAPWLTTIVVSGTIAVGLFSKWTNKHILAFSRIVPKLNQKVVDYTNQCAQNTLFIRVNGMQRKLEKETVSAAKGYLHFLVLSQLFRHSMVAIMPVMGLTLLFASIVFIVPESQKNENLFTFIILYVRFAQSLANTVNFFGAFVSFFPHLQQA
ncbi:MAG: ABC transporter ATP-binding protein, partial [Bdellovibrionales bacterium]|nr:hypothetical protein [Bdellovibrionales bacterium]NQZ19986.1 ABC transporter ATP-binding protein [Bdellovibrionales bacterium]